MAKGLLMVHWSHRDYIDTDRLVQSVALDLCKAQCHMVIIGSNVHRKDHRHSKGLNWKGLNWKGLYWKKYDKKR